MVNSATNVHVESAEDKSLVHKLRLPILLTRNKINTRSTFVGFHDTFVTCIQNALLFFILGYSYLAGCLHSPEKTKTKPFPSPNFGEVLL